MLTVYENRPIYIASKPVDFRMSIDGLSRFIQHENDSHIHDGSIYVFFNANQDKIKCLFWDRNGFVLYYKRLDKCKFRIKKMLRSIEKLTAEELEILLSGLEREPLEHRSALLEHQA